MILSSFSYKEQHWNLVEFGPLNSVNLVVGRNSVGKTRTIHAIQYVASYLQMKDFPMRPNSFYAEMSFANKIADYTWTMVYTIKVNDGIIEKENLIIGDKTLIKRTKTVAKLDGKTVNPPTDKLLVQVRRDKEQYPEIEKLMEWAEGIVCVTFSDINPLTTFISTKIFTPIAFYEIVEKLTDADKKAVLKHAEEIGYNLTSIQTIKASPDMRLVQVKEKGISDRLVDMQLSSGMLRTAYILCFLEYIKHNSKCSMLLIDDLGEGLDYGRSTHLGKMVFENCAKQGLQLIASSNDAFLMDVVDISNWQILQRNVSKITTINHDNNAEMFRKFRMTGLANFDFFSSDFIDKYLYKQSQIKQ